MRSWISSARREVSQTGEDSIFDSHTITTTSLSPNIAQFVVLRDIDLCVRKDIALLCAQAGCGGFRGR